MRRSPVDMGRFPLLSQNRIRCALITVGKIGAYMLHINVAI